MKLRQALKKAEKFKYSIRRQSWGADSCEHLFIAKLSTEVEPCLVFVDQKNKMNPGWKPSLQEVMAIDWVIVTLGAP